MNTYFEIIIMILAIYCVGFNLLRIFIKKLNSKQWSKFIKRLYMIFWIIPFNIYIYITLSLELEFFLRSIILGIILHYLMAYIGYKATLE